MVSDVLVDLLEDLADLLDEDGGLRRGLVLAWSERGGWNTAGCVAGCTGLAGRGEEGEWGEGLVGEGGGELEGETLLAGEVEGEAPLGGGDLLGRGGDLPGGDGDRFGDFLPDGEGDRLGDFLPEEGEGDRLGDFLPEGEEDLPDFLDAGGGDRLDNWGVAGCADAGLDFLGADDGTALDWVVSSGLFG